MLKLALTPRWIGGLLLALLLVSGFMTLSKWQFDASTSSIVKADPAKDTLRPYSEVLKAGQSLTTSNVDTVAEASGHYVPGSSFLVANRYSQGEQGYWVISEFIPADTDTVTTATTDHKAPALAVVRAWTKDPVIPAESQGQVTIAGRIISNDEPVTSQSLSSQDRSNPKILGSAATAQLTNLWDTPLYSGIFTVSAEVKAGDTIPVTSQNTIADNSTILGQSEKVRPVRATQAVSSTDHNWLNIFYAAEWVVFAGFALFLWYRLLKDAYEKEQNPDYYYEYSGEHFLDPETGRYYYWDEEAQQYYFFDQLPEQITDQMRTELSQ